jgi:hypothetical protein
MAGFIFHALCSIRQGRGNVVSVKSTFRRGLPERRPSSNINTESKGSVTP